MAAVARTVQSEALRVRRNALRLQQMQAQLGSSVVPPPVPNPGAEETMCVVCFDAPKDHIIVPCGRTPMCPVCREPIQQTMKVFCTCGD